MKLAYRTGSARAKTPKGVSVVVALTMAVFPLLLPGSSEGAAGVRTPVGGPVMTLARDGVGTPEVAIDRFGTTTVVWGTHYLQGPIRAMRRPSGGQWSQPVTLGEGARPQIGVDSHGAVIVVWQSNRDNLTTGVLAARRPPAGPWQPPVRLSVDVAAPGYPSVDDSEYGADSLDLSVSPGGAALVAWEWGSYHREVPYRIEAVYRPAAGPWGHLVQLRGPEWPVVGLAVAAGRGGAAQVLYSAPDEGSLVVRRRLGTGTWTPEVTVFSRESEGRELLMDPAGIATVLVDGGSAVFAVRRPAAGPWGAPVRVSPGDLARAVVDRAGTVSAAVVAEAGRLQVVRRPRRGTWRPPVTIGSTGAAGYDVTMSVSHTGDLLAAWSNPQDDLVARGRVTGKGWTARFQVFGSGGFFDRLTSAAARGGGGVFAWQKNDVVQLRVFR
jgi:hypothetical protein